MNQQESLLAAALEKIDKLTDEEFSDITKEIIKESSVKQMVVYIVVNKDLNMSLGKTCAQVGHAVQYLCQSYKYIRDSCQSPPSDTDRELIDTYSDWSRGNQSTKIVLGANSKEFNKLKNSILKPFIVTDAGKTELEPGTDTVLCFWPMEKDSDKDLKRLRLL